MASMALLEPVLAERFAVVRDVEQRGVVARLQLLQQVFSDPVVTEISAFKAFYPAEDYHQDYYAENGDQPYCQFVVAPKVEKFKKVFKERLKH